MNSKNVTAKILLLSGLIGSSLFTTLLRPHSYNNIIKNANESTLTSSKIHLANTKRFFNNSSHNDTNNFINTNKIAFEFAKNNNADAIASYSFKYTYYGADHKINTPTVASDKPNINNDFVSLFLIDKTQIIVSGFSNANFAWSKSNAISALSKLAYYAKTKFIISPKTVDNNNVDVDLLLRTTTYAGKNSEIVIGSYSASKSKSGLSGGAIAGITISSALLLALVGGVSIAGGVALYRSRAARVAAAEAMEHLPAVTYNASIDKLDLGIRPSQADLLEEGAEDVPNDEIPVGSTDFPVIGESVPDGTTPFTPPTDSPKLVINEPSLNQENGINVSASPPMNALTPNVADSVLDGARGSTVDISPISTPTKDTSFRNLLAELEQTQEGLRENLNATSPASSVSSSSVEEEGLDTTNEFSPTPPTITEQAEATQIHNFNWEESHDRFIATGSAIKASPDRNNLFPFIENLGVHDEGAVPASFANAMHVYEDGCDLVNLAELARMENNTTNSTLSTMESGFNPIDRKVIFQAYAQKYKVWENLNYIDKIEFVHSFLGHPLLFDDSPYILDSWGKIEDILNELSDINVDSTARRAHLRDTFFNWFDEYSNKMHDIYGRNVQGLTSDYHYTFQAGLLQRSERFAKSGDYMSYHDRLDYLQTRYKHMQNMFKNGIDPLSIFLYNSDFNFGTATFVYDRQ